MSSSAGVLQSKSARRRCAQPCRACCRLVRVGVPWRLVSCIGSAFADAMRTERSGCEESTEKKTDRDGIDRCDRPDRSPCIERRGLARCPASKTPRHRSMRAGHRPRCARRIAPGDRCSVRTQPAHKMERSPRTRGAVHGMMLDVRTLLRAWQHKLSVIDVPGRIRAGSTPVQSLVALLPVNCRFQIEAFSGSRFMLLLRVSEASGSAYIINIGSTPCG